MQCIINNSLTIPSINRINEITESDFSTHLIIMIPYAQSLYESILNFFQNNLNNITTIEVIQDGIVLNIYSKYHIFNKLVHHQGIQGEFIELSLKKE